MKYFSCVLLLALLCACAPPAEPPPSSIKPIDQGKVAAVEVMLKQDVEVATGSIQVSAQNDLVVLKGTVPNEAAKQRAEELAKKVEGVEKVANHLEVAP